MKKSVLTLFLLALIAFGSDGQTIRRCNNNPGVTGVNIYTTIQAAHDAAVANDIIYVEPSNASYGNLDARKRLTIIGNGYFLDKNTNVSFDSRKSEVGSITFNNGSANSLLNGVYSVSGVGNVITINDVNITVTRCYLPTINFGLSTNLVAGLNSRGNNGTVTKCVIINQVSGQNAINTISQYGYNCTFSNNIMSFRFYNLTNCVINNNVFNSGTSVISTEAIYGSTISNNIFDARGRTTTYDANSAGTGNTFSNNICLGQAMIPSGNGNVNFGDETITFLVVNPWSSITTEDSKFQLGASSPAISVGSGGTNAGAFGGASPYVLSGMPAYPVITNYVVSGVGNSSTPLNVSVTVRGNN